MVQRHQKFPQQTSRDFGNVRDFCNIGDWRDFPDTHEFDDPKNKRDAAAVRQ